MSKNRVRDSNGKFTSDSITEKEKSQDSPKASSRIWKVVKSFLGVVVIVVLIIPWTVIVYEPAKNFSHSSTAVLMEATNTLKDSLCNCQCKEGRTPPKL